MIRFRANAATGIPAAFLKRSSRAGTADRRNGRIARFRIAPLHLEPLGLAKRLLLRFGLARDQAVNHGLTLNGLQRRAPWRGFGVWKADSFEYFGNLRLQNKSY